MNSHQGNRQEVREGEQEATEAAEVVLELELALVLELAWWNPNISRRTSPHTLQRRLLDLSGMQ
jgi:hypothetical protein